MTSTRKAGFVGVGIRSLANAVLLIRDNGMPVGRMSIPRADPSWVVAWTPQRISQEVLPAMPYSQSLHSQFDALVTTMR
ncbi:hypothetical protein [Acidovorax sp. A1169]|uniref:hypothetical protein n=1 Tax=Acidovorax sp. A1169 TaxID=3059524 RepID=UPI0027380328|nr:hypothetical protein [Acidovorax sp. A1169]MDP4078687.1 hypothetical protein [Acidovorax sp. A1169]